MQADLNRFFQDYVAAYNRSLDGAVDTTTIRASFAACFVAAGPAGTACGQNDETFMAGLDQTYAFYRSIGTQSLELLHLEVMPLDAAHAMARVFYQGRYRKPSREDVTIPFDVTYLLQAQGGHPKIFAFVAGNEMALYRQHGLIDNDADGAPRTT